ncbi:MAG: TolC family protein [Lentisphaeria bacterium]|nr:TolC family protein [Lentisphaeria bacterium]
MALKLFRMIAFIGLLSGCVEYPSAHYRTLEDYRRELPREEIASLAEKKILTLADAQQTALKGNPDYLSACRAIAGAKYRYYRSLSAYLPTVDFRAGVYHSLRNSHDLLNPPAGVMPRENNLSSNMGIYASWLLFDGLEREFSAMAARQEFRRSQALDRNARRLLVRAVAYAYYDAVLAKETARIAQADLSFQESSLCQAENRYRNGLVSKASVLNFRILANRSKSAILNARYREQTARNSLASLMGFGQTDFPPELELTPLPKEDREVYQSLESCLEQAAANRPDLRAAALLLDIAQFRQWSAYAGFLPVVRAEAGLQFVTGNARYGGYSVRNSHHNTLDFTYGISGEWNLFKGFDSFNLIRERRIRTELAKFQLEETFLSAVNEVKDAYANYRNARAQVKIYRETLLWVAEQRSLVQSEFWNGRDTITRLNGAQSDLVEAQSRLAIALIELRKAVIQLQTAMNVIPFPE